MEVKEVKTLKEEHMNLEGLGKAISEAIALRQLMATLESKIGNIDTAIAGNKKEIERRKTLEAETKQFEKDKEVLVSEFQEHDTELQKRMDVLNKAGVELPLGKELPKGIVNL